LRYKNILLGVLIVIGLAIGAALWSSQVFKQASASENALEASYQSNFFNLIENIENLDVLLGKILASNSDGQDTITFVTVWSMAEVAKTNLSNLPLGTASMMRSNEYLAQLGDFCYSLAQKTSKGQEITESEWQKVRQLHQENRTIHNELRELLSLMQEKQVRFGSLANADEAADLTSESQDILDGFGKLDERLQNEVPTLTYDGPFSDHVVNRTPRGLTGQVIDKNQAAKTALQFAENINPGTKYSAEPSGPAKGRINSYSVTLQSETAGRSDLFFGISQKGGHVILMMDTGEPAKVKRLSIKQATRKAEEFVQKLGLGEFVVTGHLAEGNELLVNFAWLQDGVIIYPDMIQVSIAMDNGNAAAYDANKYLLSHTQRELPQPQITEAEARANVNPKLKIEAVRLALIPLDNLQEKLTYEVKGKIGKDTYYVYINAETGFQEKILMIVETSQGSRSI